MFQDCVSVTPFTDSTANEVFRNITGSPFFGDTSFVATLRALLKDRIGEDNICVYHNYDGVSNFKKMVKEYHNVIYVYCGEYTAEDANFDENWKEVKKVSAFYIKAFNVKCYINEKIKSVVLFVENLSKWIWHFLQCAIPAFLPWYFDPKDGLDKDEMDLIRSLMQKNSAQYTKALEVLANKTDMRSKFVNNLLNGFTKGLDERKIRNVESEIDSIRRSIKDYQDSINDLIRREYDSNITLLGLRAHAKDDDGDEYLKQYLIDNKRIDPLMADSGRFRFVVKDYITYYDQDLMEDCLKNRSSYFYDHSGMSNEHIEELMTAIFINNEFKLRVCGCFEIASDGSCQAFTGHNYNGIENIYMPNPHLDNYGCMGDHPRIIRQLIVDNCDYVGAIEQCAASCRNLNFADSTVMNNFAEYMATTGNHILELPDGTLVSPKEALRWLHRNDPKEEE